MIINEQTDKHFITSHEVFSEPLRFYTQLLLDIDRAKKTICIEIYKFVEDAIGIKFRDALNKKCKQGVKVKLLIDSWGADVSETFFDDLIASGGQVRYFKKLRRYSFDAFTKHHRRNHRKIIVIDDKMVYVGSANINDYSLNWRELIVKIEGSLALTMKKVFNDSWKIYEKVMYSHKNQLRQITIGTFKIIRDVPSITQQRLKKRFEELVKKAKKEIIIETPYFLPGFLLRKLLMDAAKRGVDVKILTPKQSDVPFVDVLRSKYLGMFYKSNLKMLFYTPNNLHAKLIIIDKELFCFGSANFDYRSFRYMFEIMLQGTDKGLLEDLLIHVNGSLEDCEPFDYEKWLRRPRIYKFFEQLLVPFRHYL
ncbi:MAG: phosphatidylserine/phosphatidylglycerophosphate/cardiolipin synthase family protein [Bacteroidota bacterium]